MAKRQKAWARKARKKLQHALGDKCAKCGKTDNLTFDCIQRRGHKHHAMDPASRMCFYRKEARQGNLRILCGPCHAKEQNQSVPADGQLYTLRNHEPTPAPITSVPFSKTPTSIKESEQWQ
jgi:hypothetical protein